MRIIELEQTCYACPSQWEGKTLSGQDVYIRYRWGYLSISIDEKAIYGEQIGDEWSGVLAWRRVEEILNSLGYEVQKWIH